MTDPDQTGDNETTSAMTRFRWTNDGLAAVLIVSEVGILAGALYTGYQLPDEFWWVVEFSVLLAAAWAFGDAAFANVAKVFGGGGRDGRPRPRRRRPPARDIARDVQEERGRERSRSERAREQERDENGNFR
ncbi:hypothetical protein [Halocalculus aciditolerans]|uniref:Uncharacterized protein n=1 Tax=Halocalculus aciditolerans TaxID=1383812 RepID=A0A830FLG5_9EURY|nr:hypothetical protein [Halocalculus aciditolerans]GGL57990.1 hypothetical protein GCM10009039_15230 [Halocalculus aciditolerans]